MKSRLLSSLGIAFLPLMLFTLPIVVFFKSNGLSPFSIDLVGLFAIPLIILFAVSFLLFLVSDIFKGIIIALGILFFIDYQINFEEINEILISKSKFFHEFSFEITYSIIFLILFIFLSIYFSHLKHRHYKIILTIFLFIYLFVLFVPLQKTHEYLNDLISPQSERLKTGHLPPIVNIIMDGHGAIEAMPDSIPEVKEAKDTLMHFYNKNNFVVFTHGLSLYSDADDAISNLLNFSQLNQHRYYFEGQRKNLTLKDNKYFNYLNHKGYVFNIYQTQKMNFCDNKNVKIARCVTYNDEFPINIINELEDSNEKRTLILEEFLRSSYLVRLVGEFFNFQLKHLYDNSESFSFEKKPLNRGSLDLLKKLGSDVIKEGDSNVYFAHLNFPNSPYYFKKDCSKRSYQEGWFKAGENKHNLEQSRINRELAFKLHAEQMLCAYKTLENLIEEWKNKGHFDDMIISIQGTTGFGLSVMPPQLQPDPQQGPQIDRDHYATHFAYHKAPSGSGETNNLFLIKNVFSGIFKQHPFAEEKDPQIFVPNPTKENPNLLVKRAYQGKQ